MHLHTLSITQQLFMIAPLLVLGFGSLIVLMVSLFSPAKASAGQSASAAKDPGSRVHLLGLEMGVFLVIILALFSLIQQLGQFRPGVTVFDGVLYTDGLAGFFSVIILLGTVLALMVSAGALAHWGISALHEYYSLILMSTFGALIFANAAELITMFLGLEIMSMGLYCLCGSVIPHPRAQDEKVYSAPPVRQSAESAIKYFLLGSFSSAFLLYGIALVYGLTGSTHLQTIGQLSGTLNPVMLSLAIGLMLVGLGFKIGLVPFHSWAPDVYQGAPTAVTAYMACVIKIAAVAAALRVITVTFGVQIGFWAPALWIVAVLTMTVGNLLALRQKRSTKRLLAYSSIAHAGYMMAGFLAYGSSYGGSPAVLYYLVSYCLMTIGAFAVLIVLSSSSSNSEGSDDLELFDGLGSRRPVLALVMSLFLLSLAGIPPGMAGFVGKFFLFSAAVRAEYVGLVILGVLNSAISCYYYLHIIVRMYFSDDLHEPQKPLPRTEGDVGYLSGFAIGICAVGVVLIGLYPGGLFDGLSSLFVR